MLSFLRHIFIFSLLVLAAAKCPTYIDTVVPGGPNAVYGKREPGDPLLATMRDVHNTLSDCDSLKSLKLRVTNIGCSEHPDRWDFPLDLACGSVYPSKLESLDLEGYHFGDRMWDEISEPPYRTNSKFWDTMEWIGSGRALKWVRYLPLSAEQKAKTNLDLLLDAMDFGSIKNLTLRPRFGHYPDIAKLISHLKSLQSLKVYGAWAKDLILGVPENSLTHLSWIFSDETGASVLPVLRHHAQSLKSFEWREAESGIRQRRVMTAEEISEVGRMAPNLESITLDVNRNGTWPVEVFDALATNFPKVTNITVFLEFASECRRQLGASMEGVYGYDQWKLDLESDCSSGIESMAQPVLDTKQAMKLFYRLRENKVGDLMKKVVFYAGDWERPWDGALAESEWLDGRRTYFLCEAVYDPPYTSGGGCRGMTGGIPTRGSSSGYEERETHPLSWTSHSLLDRQALRLEL